MADFYGTAAGFTAYWTARGNAVLASMDAPDIEIALLIASEWLDASFIWNNYKVGQRAQVREWPRYGMVDQYGYAIPSDAIPREVVQANYVAAAKQLLTPGVFYRDYTPGKYRNVSISGAISVEYATGDAYAFQTQMPEIGAILGPLLRYGGPGNLSPLSGSISRA